MLRIPAFIALLALSAPSWAFDEGMWQFNNLPLDQLKQKYNFAPTPEWLDHVMKSSVRLNDGRSGSFVSSTGLVLTNHRVASDTLQKISVDGHDHFKTGFYAATNTDEAKSPDLVIDELVAIVDVTARVNAAVQPGMTSAEAFQAKQIG